MEESQVNRAVVLNELNAEVARLADGPLGDDALTLSDLEQYGVDREASQHVNPAVVLFTDGSAIHYNGATGWWMPGRGQW
jgi:hypothetical protein